VTLQLDAATLDLILGGSGTVQVTATRSSEATAPLALQVDGAPDWVTVTFSPSSLTGSTLESTMTVSTDAHDPDAEPTSFVLTVQAVGTGLNAQRTLEVNVGLLEVNGTLIDALGAPLAGLTVTSPGQAPVVSGVDGSFTLSDMTVPYDLVVVDTANSVGHRFEGLTAAEPRVMPISAIISGLTGDLSATVSGTLTHASLIPVPANHGATVCLEGLNGSVVACDYLGVGESDYDLFPSWWQPDDLNVRVRAYVYEADASGKPTAIVAVGTAGPTLLSDSDNAMVNVNLSDASGQASVTVDVSVPPGYDIANLSLVTHYGQFASFALGTGGSDSATETLIAPFFSGAPLTVLATGSPTAPDASSSTIAWSSGHMSGDSVDLDLPQPATAISPAEGATGITSSTVYSVANTSGGVLTYLLQPTGIGPVFATTTMAETATFPDLATFGMGLPTSASYFWGVIATHHVTSTDDAVTGAGYLGDFVALSVAAAGGGGTISGAGQVSSTGSVDVTTE